ncbi:MAG: hypothetical protein M3347_00950 [Armatimonadota bacterium]|nr:hypothetical protein [Armatimonadota bacterium]
MAEMTIQESLWDDLVVIAKQRRQQPQELVQQVLREYIQRLADEDLLDRSARAARCAKFHMRDTEAILRQHRLKTNRHA